MVPRSPVSRISCLKASLRLDLFFLIRHLRRINLSSSGYPFVYVDIYIVITIE